MDLHMFYWGWKRERNTHQRENRFWTGQERNAILSGRIKGKERNERLKEEATDIVVVDIASKLLAQNDVNVARTELLIAAKYEKRIDHKQ